jgi:CubicO group peptidase (beta-lactamase class C family)
MLYRSLIIAALLLVLLPAYRTARHHDMARRDMALYARIDSLCRQQIDKGGFPGMAVAIGKGKHVIWINGYGFADIDRQIAVDPTSHLFRIGSVSKAVTASALARLVAKGRIDLDAPISTYMDSLPPDKDSLTLREIGGHLAGIRHYRGFEFMSNLRYDDVLAPLEVFIHDTLLSAPNTKYNYSTYGWTLVSAVMQEAIDEPFLDILREQVSKPLDLEDLRADNNDSTRYNRPVYYHRNDGKLVPTPTVDNSNKWAGGGLLCSAEDLVHYGLAHTRGRYVSEKKLAPFITSQQTLDGTPTNYGIGFATGKDDAGRTWCGHSGGSVGGTSMLLIYPEHDLVVVTLVNLSGAEMDRLAWRIADVLLSAEKQAKR